MTCEKCVNARRFAEGGVYCVQYGMIIRADHECRLKGAVPVDEPDDLVRGRDGSGTDHGGPGIGGGGQDGREEKKEA